MKRMARIKPEYVLGARNKGDWTSVSKPLQQALKLVTEGDKGLDCSSAAVHIDRMVISRDQAIEFLQRQPLA